MSETPQAPEWTDLVEVLGEALRKHAITTGYGFAKIGEDGVTLLDPSDVFLAEPADGAARQDETPAKSPG